MILYTGSGETVNFAEPKKNPYEGKNLAVLGDSISATYSLIAEKYWSQWVAELLGMTLHSYGHGGSSIADSNSMKGYEFYVRYANMTDDADVIIVMGGVNDVWHKSTLGQMGDTTGATIYGALDVLCQGLRSKYPLGDILFLTPTEQNSASCTSAAQANGFDVYEVQKAMKEVCEKYAIPVYDNRVLSGFYPDVQENWDAYSPSGDGLHWNTAFQEKVGREVANYLLRMKGHPGIAYLP